MKRTVGPSNPVSPNPNGKFGYSFNPVEDIPVTEDLFQDYNFSDDYYTEPVFSSQATYGFNEESYDHKK
jgi:hypothetical protein